jgi:hypothetical protein
MSDTTELSDRPADASPTPAGTAPPTHAGWAVATLLCFWPLAFSAFTHAFGVYPLWASGDAAAAQHASDRVRRLGQLSVWIAAVLVVITVVLCTIAAVVLIAHGDYETPRHGMEHGGEHMRSGD